MLEWVEQFHRDEGGAVLVLMLAGAMVLLLLGWTLYDSATTVNSKVTVQGSADMAALSQASVKARSMNMMAYSNIAKRSIFAIHSTYISSFVAYGQLAQAFNWIGGVVCNQLNKLCKLKNVGRSAIQRWKAEADPDFERFSGIDDDKVDKLVRRYENAGPSKQQFFAKVLDAVCGGSGAFQCFVDIIFSAIQGDDLINQLNSIFRSIRQVASDQLFSAEDLRTDELAPDEWGGLTQKYYAQDIKALDNYQRYLAGAAPWWAWMESVSRGLRNGATATASSPLPPGMPRETDRLGQKLSRVFDYPITFLNGTQINDVLPVRPGIGPTTNKRGANLKPLHPNEELMFRKVSKQVESQTAGLIGNISASLFSSSGPSLGSMLLEQPFAVEHLVNVILSALYTRYPQGATGFQIGFGAAFVVWTHDLETQIDGATLVSQEVLDAQLGPYVANPWILNRYRNEADWLAHASNIVFTYKNRGSFEERRSKHEIVDGEMGRRSNISDELYETIYRATGQWGMARSEIVFQGPDGDQPDLWHPVWSSRIRPVALTGEFENSQITMRRAYHDALAGLAVTTILGVTKPSDLGNALLDFAQMERATSAMGPTTAEGVVR